MKFSGSKVLCVALGLMAMLWLGKGNSFAASISAEPSLPSVTAGSYFDLLVEASEISDLYGYQFDLGFDPSLLAATNVTEGPFLSTGGTTIFFPGTIDNTAGTVAFTADVLDGAIAGVTGSGVIADIQFRALSQGASTLDLSNLILLDSDLNDISAAIVNGTVDITASTAVPEPSTWLLLSFGLVGLSVYIARRQAA